MKELEVIQATHNNLSSETKEQFRVVIQPDANKNLEEIVQRVNEGFDGGEVTKSDIANYIFLQLQRLISESGIKAIRMHYFDEKKCLASILRNENELPEELRKAIRIHYGLLNKEKKKSA